MSTPSKIGLVNGCFDLFHSGHGRFLWEAKKRCTYLIVGVNDDASVRRLKGDSRPFDLLRYRMDRVSAYADQVLPFDGDAAALLREANPDIVIRGWDQTIEDCFERPRTVIVLPRYGEISTTAIGAAREG